MCRWVNERSESLKYRERLRVKEVDRLLWWFDLEILVYVDIDTETERPLENSFSVLDDVVWKGSGLFTLLEIK